MIARDLRDESRSLLVAFRSLRQTTTLDEMRAEADVIALARGVRLTWDTEPDRTNAAAIASPSASFSRES